jgi:hypothetical protein
MSYLLLPGQLLGCKCEAFEGIVHISGALRFAVQIEACWYVSRIV